MRTGLSATLLATIALCLSACDQGSTSTTQPAGDNATAGTTEAKWHIGMSQCNLGEPWRVQMNADVKAAADQHPDLRVTYKDAGNDTLKQRAHVEEFVSAGVDLIIISPKEAAPLTEPVAKAMDAGIPVIVLDRRVLGDKYTCFIGADNVAIGRAAGEWIADTLDGEGRVVELKGLMTSTPGQDRHSGFRAGIDNTDIEVIFEADMKWLEPDARKEMESALARFDDIDLVYAHNDPGAHGAYLAAKAAGRADDILFVGIDALPTKASCTSRRASSTPPSSTPPAVPKPSTTALQILARRRRPPGNHPRLPPLHPGKRHRRRQTHPGPRIAQAEPPPRAASKASRPLTNSAHPATLMRSRAFSSAG
jgi:ribose transport system substrate-binding protein